MDLLEGTEVSFRHTRAVSTTAFNSTWNWEMVNDQGEEKWLVRVGASLVSLMYLLSAAIWNGYPIVYSDTSSYLASGFHLETLVDRPITYGLFIRLCSLDGWSLWTVVIAQSMLLAYAAGLALRSTGIHNAWLRSAIIGGTALLTGLPFVCGQIITDVFTPILVITLYLLLFVNDLSRKTRILLFGLFLLAFATHMSHVSITVLLLALALLLRWSMRRHTAGLPNLRTIGMILLLAIVGTLAMGVSLAKSKYSFYAAHMAETGVLQRYLEEHCATEQYRLCDRLGTIPRSADAFLWADDSPLKIYESRQQMERELGRITMGTFREPALIWMQLRTALEASAQQLTRFAVGDGNGSFGKGTLLHERIGAFIPSEIGAFDSSRQMNGAGFRQAVDRWNQVLNIIMVISLLMLLLLWAFSRRSLVKHPHLLLMTVFLLGALAINTTVNASLVMVADRFGTKLAWLVPFLIITSAVASIAPRNKNLR